MARSSSRCALRPSPGDLALAIRFHRLRHQPAQRGQEMAAAVVLGHRVIHPSAFTAFVDEACGFKNFQVARELVRGDGKGLGKLFPIRFFAVGEELPDDPQPQRIAKRFEDTAEAFHGRDNCTPALVYNHTGLALSSTFPVSWQVQRRQSTRRTILNIMQIYIDMSTATWYCIRVRGITQS